MMIIMNDRPNDKNSELVHTYLTVLFSGLAINFFIFVGQARIQYMLVRYTYILNGERCISLDKEICHNRNAFR